MEAKIPELQASGITHLWLPPPSQSVSAQGYLPGQVRGGRVYLRVYTRALTVWGCGCELARACSLLPA